MVKPLFCSQSVPSQISVKVMTSYSIAEEKNVLITFHSVTGHLKGLKVIIVFNHYTLFLPDFSSVVLFHFSFCFGFEILDFQKMYQEEYLSI